MSDVHRRGERIFRCEPVFGKEEAACGFVGEGRAQVARGKAGTGDKTAAVRVQYGPLADGELRHQKVSRHRSDVNFLPVDVVRKERGSQEGIVI